MAILSSEAAPDRSHRSPGRWAGLGIALFAAYVLVMALLPLSVNHATLSLLYLVLYFVLLSCGWNILSGFTGYINFGYVVFVGVGMYASAILISEAHAPWYAGVALGGIVSALYAGILGVPLLRLKGPYFAIVTLAISEGTRVIIGSTYLSPLTRGGAGISLFTNVTLQAQYYTMLAFVVVAVATTFFIANSRRGLRLLAIGQDERAAENLGVNTTLAKVIAFVLSAFFAGLAGGLHATFVSYVDPVSGFDINFTVTPMIMTVFGGISTVLGPVFGATVLEFLNNYIWLHVLQLNLAVFGLILVILILFLPRGVVQWLKDQGWLPKTRAL